MRLILEADDGERIDDWLAVDQWLEENRDELLKSIEQRIQDAVKEGHC